MAFEKTDGKTDTTSMSLIIGLIIGATIAVVTNQWWWSTVGVLAGAACGAITGHSRN